jgi:AraC-like DNA-binding protein
VEVYRYPVFYSRLHQHEEIQISCIVQGNGRLIVGDSVHSYASGDIYVLGSTTPHLFQSRASEEHSCMISIFFTKEGFGNVFSAIPELQQVSSFFALSAKGLKVRPVDSHIQKLFLKLPEVDELQRFILFLQLIQQLLQVEGQELVSTVPSTFLSHAQGERLQLIFDYLMTHFQDKIELHQIAGIVHMTPHSFCRFFKQKTNKTFFQFLIELRIEHACQLLVDPKQWTIAEISERSGFSSLSNFNRKFKQIKKMTPSTFIKQHHGERMPGRIILG